MKTFPLLAAASASAKEPSRNPGVSGGYELVFSDEFDGSRLDAGKWWTRYVYNGGMLDHFNDERHVYRENGNHVLTNGVLSLVAREIKLLCHRLNPASYAPRKPSSTAILKRA